MFSCKQPLAKELFYDGEIFEGQNPNAGKRPVSLAKQFITSVAGAVAGERGAERCGDSGSSLRLFPLPPWQS